MESIPKQILETYTNIYFRNSILKKNEKFESTNNSTSYNILVTIIAWFTFGYAVYLSFRCNNGFSGWGLAGAIFFQPFYIIYKLTSTPKFCGYMK